jgi:ubiquinone/menaquinone biosynthesis C-methylase UbiE
MSGCGTSRLSEEMYDDGFSSIVNIDFVAPAIDIMATRNKGKSGLTWQVMDATALTFPDAYFDAVIDKGTLDSLLCGENSTANASKMCAEMARVLKPGGNYMVISYGNPESRLAYLEKEEYKWRVTAHTLRKCHFLLYRPASAHNPCYPCLQPNPRLRVHHCRTREKHPQCTSFIFATRCNFKSVQNLVLSPFLHYG